MKGRLGSLLGIPMRSKAVESSREIANAVLPFNYRVVQEYKNFSMSLLHCACTTYCAECCCHQHMQGYPTGLKACDVGELVGDTCVSKGCTTVQIPAYA